MRDNIVLIGMPGSGKSTIGIIMSRASGLDYTDTDRVIRDLEGQSLAELSESEGTEGFRALENRIVSGLDVHRCVIATGGSVIYGADAMRRLREIGVVAYLQLSCGALEERLGDLKARGVSMRPGQTLRELYRERCPLYERYADITVRCDGLRPREVSAAVLQAAAPLLEW